MHIVGTILSVIYNRSTYYILDVEEKGGDGGRRTVKGNFFGLDRLAPGIPLTFSGSWIRSSKYGKQFQAKSWDLPADVSEVQKSRIIEVVAGFDYFSAETLKTKYGSDVLKALQDLPLLERDFPEASLDFKACLMKWARLRAVKAMSDVLKDGGLSASEIEAAVIKFGMQAPLLVKENPFRLMEIPGFSFERVDSLALKLGFGLGNPQRLEGAVLWALNEAGRNGHLFLKKGDIPTLVLDLKNSVGPLPFKDTADRGIKEAVAALEDRNSVVTEAGVGVYLPENYKYERESAALLAKLLTPSALQVDLEVFLQEFEKSSQLNLSDAQQDAVRQLIEHKVLVLTGLPGTGKTTAVRALVRLFEASKTSFSLMAPTGIASKRLSHVTSHPASTIHRALGYDGSKWVHGPDNKFVVDAVIVDEASMVDMELFYRLLSSLRPDTMLVLVGDDAQLPAVGPGNVLKELISCSAIPSVRLTKIFRQEAQGEIVLNSHRINKGELPVLGDPRGTSEFRFIPQENEEKACRNIVQMALKLKARDANFQVLSPKYDGAVGVVSLNQALRDALNPQGPPEWKGKTQHFRLGDRLMIVKNNYNKGVWNGDVGKLLYIGADQLVVRIYGVGSQPDQEVKFTELEAEETLRLAYAITVHKSQGSEFDTIIMPVMGSQGRMLQRNLLYTAVTRAKKKVWLIGEELAVRQSVANNKVRRRNTVLGSAVIGVLESDHGRR